MRKLLRSRRGATAAEMVVVLGLFSVLSTGLMGLFSTALTQYQRSSGKSDADDAASLISQSIILDIVPGKSAAVVNGGLEVQLPGLNDQGDYDRSTNGDLIRYYVSNGTLYRKVNGGTAGIVTLTVQSFTFSVVGGSVTVTLTVTRQCGTKISQTSFTQRVALRNYVGP